MSGLELRLTLVIAAMLLSTLGLLAQPPNPLWAQSDPWVRWRTRLWLLICAMAVTSWCLVICVWLAQTIGTTHALGEVLP